VTKAAEPLGDRWTLLIVRELLVGPLRFGEIERGLPGISRSVLSQRLSGSSATGS
jgi:DNA-binding HxlR family transcriptional regulator